MVSSLMHHCPRLVKLSVTYQNRGGFVRLDDDFQLAEFGAAMSGWLGRGGDFQFLNAPVDRQVRTETGRFG